MAASVLIRSAHEAEERVRVILHCFGYLWFPPKVPALISAPTRLSGPNARRSRWPTRDRELLK
eukprot:13728380-Heterocapsa_arctica.AAC.1